MLLRLIVLGAAVSLIAAFLGRRRLALGLLAGLSVAAVGLWGYEAYQAQFKDALFADNDIVISNVRITPSSYRPNLFELSGRIQNNASQTTLDGVMLALQLKDCVPAKPCRKLPPQQQFVATRLAPGNAVDFLEKIYLDKPWLPKGELKVDYSRESLRGHRPIW